METVTILYFFGGRWQNSLKQAYIGGDSKCYGDVDIDYLSFTHMLKTYRKDFGEVGVKKLCYQIQGTPLENSELVVLEDDEGIKNLSELIRSTFRPDSVLCIYPMNETSGAIGGDVRYNISEKGQVGVGCSGTKEGQVTGTEKEHIDLSNEMEIIINQYISLGDSFDGPVDVPIVRDDGPTDGNVVREHVTDVRVEPSDVLVVREEPIILEEESSETATDTDLFDSELHAIEYKLINQHKRRVKYDVDDNNPYFLVGMSFTNADEARMAIRRYSVAKCTPLRIKPNDTRRLRVKCKTEECPFFLLISKETATGSMVVRNFKSEHNCLREANNKLASAKFIATAFKDKIYENPKTTVNDIITEAGKYMKLHVSVSKVKRAKRYVMTEMEGSFKAQFACMEKYVRSIKEQSPGTTAELELCEESLRAGKSVFKRVFFCFDALKRGWRAGCRPIIGIDGCHLKSEIKGQLLVAVGRDGENQLYPIAWAVIGIENKDNWMWFLKMLVNDLEITDEGKSLTIMSDMQKGLVHAVSEILPYVEHRYCARHVYSNWSKKWPGEDFKRLFWICAWSTFKEEFEDNLRALGDVCKEAAENFVAYNPIAFCRAFFSSRSKCFSVDNNITESFNSTLLKCRFKPIISMLDEIRLNAMTRLASNKFFVDTWKSDWSRACMETYQENMDIRFDCKLAFNGADGYEIWDRCDRHRVYLDKCHCTCRLWDLTGIPCAHAYLAIEHAKKDPKAFISKWYHKSAYVAAYEHAIEPNFGKLVKETGSCEKIEPPPTMKLTGRPRKKRIRAKNEVSKRKRDDAYGKASGKLSTKGLGRSCSICHSRGHMCNKCPNKPSQNSSQAFASNQPTTGVEGQTNPLVTGAECQTSHVPRAKKARKNKTPTGLGILFDENSGNMILDPGFPSERLVAQVDTIASHTLRSNPDPNVSYPIPNEREIRQSIRASRVLGSSGTRQIAYIGDGSTPIAAGELPYKSPGLNWDGKMAVSTTQLQAQRDAKRAKKKDTNKT